MLEADIANTHLGHQKNLRHYPQYHFRKEVIDYERTDIIVCLNEETGQTGKEHAYGQPCEESMYEIKGQEQIGRQEIYKQKRTEQNRILHGGGREKLQQRSGGEVRCGVK
jgi:hypothetical protein